MTQFTILWFLLQLCVILEVQKCQLRAKAVPIHCLGLFTLFPAAWLPISPVCHSSCLGPIPRVSCHAEEATAGAAVSLSLTPLRSQDVASAANPDQEHKQAPRFPRLNVVIISNPH